MINKNDEKEMKALMGIEPAHYGKWMYFLLPLTQPTELYKLISNSFEKYTWLLNMPAWCFDFNVYKRANVNMVITVEPTKSDSDVIFCLQLISKTFICTINLS